MNMVSEFGKMEKDGGGGEGMMGDMLRGMGGGLGAPKKKFRKA